MYLNIHNLKYISTDKKQTNFKITAKLDGISSSEEVLDRTSSAYYMENPNFLINLGTTKHNQDNKLKLIFNKKGIYTFDSIEVLAVSMEEYDKKVDNLKRNAISNIEYGNNYVKGNIDISNNGILQISTSYSDGWKVYIDGKKQEIIKVNEAFVGTIIEKGKHYIEFEYKTPYLNYGIILSIIGIIAFALITVSEKRRDGII